MKNLIIILIILCSTSIYSQELDDVEWSPSGATWVYSSNENGLGDTKHYRLYKYEKDTFAYNLNLKKIVKYSFTVLHTPENNKIRSSNDYISTYFFYNSNDSIFYINSSENLELLYTFSENLGTSGIIQSTTNSFLNSLQYPIACDSLVNFQDQATINLLKLDTISDIVYSSTELASSFMEWEYGDIYKNIGPSKSFFATPIYDSKDSCSQFVDYIGYFKENALIAYYDDLRGYNFNLNKEFAHFITTPIKSLTKDDNFLIYPNPTSKLIHIQKTKEILSVSIMNYEGSLIEMIKENFDTISLEKYERGVYFLIIESKNNNLTKKIIKL